MNELAPEQKQDFWTVRSTRDGFWFQAVYVVERDDGSSVLVEVAEPKRLKAQARKDLEDLGKRSDESKEWVDVDFGSLEPTPASLFARHVEGIIRAQNKEIELEWLRAIRAGVSIDEVHWHEYPGHPDYRVELMVNGKAWATVRL